MREYHGYLDRFSIIDRSVVAAYLISGCLVKKTGDAQVTWNVEAGEIANLRYSHI